MPLTNTVRTAFVGSLLAISLLVVIGSVYLLWPIWNKHRAVTALMAAVHHQIDSESDTIGMDDELTAAIEWVQNAAAEREATIALVDEAASGNYTVFSTVRDVIEDLDADRAVPALVELLRGPNTSKREVAAFLVGQFGSDARLAVPNLVENLRSPVARIRARSAESLGAIGDSSEAVVTAIIATLQDDEDFVRRRVAQALGRLGRNTPNVTTALNAALNDNDVWVREAAEIAIRNITRGGVEGVEGVEEVQSVHTSDFNFLN